MLWNANQTNRKAEFEFAEKIFFLKKKFFFGACLVNLAYSCCRTESLKFPLLLPSVLLARTDIGRFIASLQTVVRASSYSGRGSWD